MLVAISAEVSVLFVLVFLRALRVPKAHEAMIISGPGIRSRSFDGMGRLDFKVATAGKVTIAVPLLHVVHRLRLGGYTAPLDLRYVAPQGIRVQVSAIVHYRIGGDAVSVANAAGRFLDQEEAMDQAVAEVFTGQLRSILGDLSLDSFLIVRNQVAHEAEGSAADEMSGLGLITERCVIARIDDEDGYISDLAHQQIKGLTEANAITDAEFELLDYGAPDIVADLDRVMNHRRQMWEQALMESKALSDAQSARAKAEYEQQAAERAARRRL